MLNSIYRRTIVPGEFLLGSCRTQLKEPLGSQIKVPISFKAEPSATIEAEKIKNARKAKDKEICFIASLS